MRFINQLFRSESEEDHSDVKIKHREKDFSGRSHFYALFRPVDSRQEARFHSAISRESAYTYSPQKIFKPTQLLSLERQSMSKRGGERFQSLTRPWVLELAGVSFLGTEDHHELYFQLLNRNANEFSPDDVLLNIDAHDDVSQSQMKSEDVDISIGDFVGMGFQETIRKTWDHYFLVTRPRSYSVGSEKNLPPDKFVRLKPEHLYTAMEKAVEVARTKHSQVIITIDLDFFGCGNIVEFDPQESERILGEVLKFVRKNKQYIRLVHFTESLDYAVEGDTQISTIYKQLVTLLKNFTA